MLKVKKLNENAILPTKKPGDAGYDFYSVKAFTLMPGERMLVGTGVAIEIPVGYVGLIWPRSGLALNWGLDRMAGVIDSSYRGEVGILLYNSGEDIIMMGAGSKIAQMVIQQHAEFEVVESELSNTERQEKGFGSSGV